MVLSKEGLAKFKNTIDIYDCNLKYESMSKQRER